MTDEQKLIADRIYKQVRNSINNFYDEKSCELLPPLHYIVQGGPGCGKTTLFKEIVRQVRAYLLRFSARLYVLRRSAQSYGVAARDLETKISRFNEIVLGIKQLATTGAGACVVQNNCQTVHSFFKIPVCQAKGDNERAILQEENKKKKDLDPMKIDPIRNELTDSGCRVITIDEVSFVWWGFVAVNFVWLNLYLNVLMSTLFVFADVNDEYAANELH